MASMVLVPGAGLGAWAWEAVIPELRAAGHDVHALTLTGFGDRAHLATPDVDLATHVDDVVAAIEVARLDDVVLVGHSYAGMVITAATERLVPRLRRLVYVAGAVPGDGESLFDIMEPGAEEIMREVADAHGDGWLLPFLTDEQLDAFYGDHDLGEDDRRWLHERATGQPLATLTGKVELSEPRAAALPRTYVVCTGDPGPPPEQVKEPGWDLDEIATGHWPMRTAPAALVEVLDRWAGAAGPLRIDEER